MLGGEDCLYLNVFAPADALMDRTAPLPVMVWIHGGGNRNGEGGDLSNARLPVDYDVIVVTFNYRMGPLGWLAHESLRLEGEASPNFANLDHVAALRWVQDNIANFGGNPANVTVFGQSAGAANILSLVQNPLAKGLFHRAIIQSGRGQTRTMADAGRTILMTKRRATLPVQESLPFKSPFNQAMQRTGAAPRSLPRA